jgi:hypothetical protein
MAVLFDAKREPPPPDLPYLAIISRNGFLPGRKKTGKAKKWITFYNRCLLTI